MGFTVSDLLKTEILKDAVLLGGEAGLSNEIQGVTIIEAPDILRFISGGEFLLTSFYAFQSCTPEEFREYFQDLPQKKVSALALKRGRDVEYIHEKIEILLGYAREYHVPVLEIPFDLSFREILKNVMEHLFNEEVLRLKYFKTTHDNFAALSLSFHSMENGIQRILDVLEKLIGNPVSLFNQNMDCLASTDERISELVLDEKAREYEPDFYSNYTYFRQNAQGGELAGCNQYLVRLNVMYNARMYLAITECNNPMKSMDYIAVENAVTALKQELFRQQSIGELEKKFQNDVMNNLLNGKIHSRQELMRDLKLLGIPVDAEYRVIMLDIKGEGEIEEDSLSSKMKYVNALRDAADAVFNQAKVMDDLDKVIVIQQVKPGQKQEEYRKCLKEAIAEIQKRISMRKKNLRVCAGVGKEVEGVLNISESFKEAGSSLEFIDVLGEKGTDHTSEIMMFSDMGIFKLLRDLKEPEQLLEFVPESLQKLYNYKKHQRNDLLATLNTYLDYNQNLTKTAQDLFIHYKTAAYRVERISEITGLDFDNPSEVLAVRIGLIVYKMIENLGK